MKFQIFFFLTIIFIIYIFVEVIEAWNVGVTEDMLKGTRCRLWITNRNNDRIAGDSPNEYHNCHNRDKYMTIPNDEYWVHVKVQGSLRDEKVRYVNSSADYDLEGDVASWTFKERDD